MKKYSIFVIAMIVSGYSFGVVTSRILKAPIYNPAKEAFADMLNVVQNSILSIFFIFFIFSIKYSLSGYLFEQKNKYDSGYSGY